MRRLRRNFARLTVALSLLLALALVALWVRSYWRTDARGRSRYVADRRELRGYSVGSQRGRVGLNYWILHFNPAAALQVNEESGAGRIYLVDNFAITYRSRWSAGVVAMGGLPPEHWWERAGFSVQVNKHPIGSSEPTGTSSVFVTVPYWCLLAATLVWPGVWGAGWWRRKRRVAKGLCGNCGYDLRGSGGRCSECGRKSCAHLREKKT